MELLWQTDRKKAINELVEGEEYAIQLQTVIRKLDANNETWSLAAEFVGKILATFANSLSVLKNSGESGESSFASMMMMTQVGSPCSDDRKSEISGAKRKVSGMIKDRRGGYKRRKNLETSTKLTATPIEDGFSWRKYGQKEILNAKFPRNYFRCTHKNDGCQAIKHVQKTEDDPPMYRTIYMGHHSCRSALRAPQITLDSAPTTYVLSFQSNNIISTTTTALLDHILPTFPSIKQEYEDEIPNDHTSTSDYLISPDFDGFEASRPASVLGSTSGSDHGDVISSMYECTTSSMTSFDNVDDLMVNFDNFPFGDDEFLLSSCM